MGRRRGVDDAAITTVDEADGTALDDPLHWPARLAKIRIGTASRGTGWAIGEHGILTARHVIEPLLASGVETPRGTAEIVVGAGPSRSFEADLVWESESSGLAILSVAERNRLSFRTLLRSSAALPVGYPRPEPIEAVTLSGLAGRDSGKFSTTSWILAPPQYVGGTLTPGDHRNARSTLDVDRRLLPRAARRHGTPGGVVLATEPAPMVLGIVTARPRGRRMLHFEVATLPDPDTTPDLAAALVTVGAAPVVTNMDGPTLQRYLHPDCLDEALRPRRVSEVDDPGWFGVAVARTDIAEPANPYFGWVSRPEADALRRAIDRALTGVGPRILVLQGPSAAGKSRLAAEVVRTHTPLRDFALLRPRPERSLLDLPERLWPTKCVIFIDNLQDYPSTALTHEKARLLLRDHAQLIVIATALDPPEASGSARLVDSGVAKRTDDALGAGFPLTSASLSGVMAVLGDDTLTAIVPVRADSKWARAGGSTNRSDWALARAKKQGLGLGEYLAGYHELVDHYTAARWPTRALVDLVGDWARSGIGEPLPVEAARLLWERLVPTQLPRDELRAFSRLTPIERERKWRGALTYACDTVLGCGSLVVQEPAGLVASEFSRVHIDQGAIGAGLWDFLLGEFRTTPLQRVDLGIAALGSGTPQRALRAFETVLYFRDDDVVDPAQRPLIEVVARRGVAIYHGRMGRDEQAIMVYTDLVDTFGGSKDPDICEQVAQALLGIGLTFSRLGSHGQAVSAYTELVRRYQDHASPSMSAFVAKALLGQATTLAVMGRHDEERAAYADIVARYDDEPGMAVQAIVAIAHATLGQVAGE